MADEERRRQNADWVREVCGDFVEDWCGNTIADHIEEIYTKLEAERDEVLGQLRSIDSEGKTRSLQAQIQRLMAERDDLQAELDRVFDSLPDRFTYGAVGHPDCAAGQGYSCAVRLMGEELMEVTTERDEARQLAQWIYDHRFSELKGLVTMENGDFLDWGKDHA